MNQNWSKYIELRFWDYFGTILGPFWDHGSTKYMLSADTNTISMEILT